MPPGHMDMGCMWRPPTTEHISFASLLSSSPVLAISGCVSSRGTMEPAPARSGRTRKKMCRMWLWSVSPAKASFLNNFDCGLIVIPIASSIALREADVWLTAQMPHMRLIMCWASSYLLPRSIASKKRGDSIISRRSSLMTPFFTSMTMFPWPSTRVSSFILM